MEKKKRRFLPWIIIAAIVLVVTILATQVGLYSIQPIGALPEGSTWLVWRHSGEPYFNSADALSLERTGAVSLFTRGLALSQAPKDRIIIRLPFWKFAYLRSTGGKEFSK